MKAFRAAIESRDLSNIADLMADDIVFRSPVAFKPYVGPEITAAIIRGVSRVFTDFRYVQELADEDPSTGSGQAGSTVLVFETFVDGVSTNGIDLIGTNEDGLISEFTVMVRPLSAANALAQAMGAQFDQIQAEAMAELSGETR